MTQTRTPKAQLDTTLIDTTSTQTLTNKSLAASSINSGTLAVANGGTNLASGTSGGVLFYSSTTVIGSTALLSANNILVGGGAGVAPFSTGVTIDSTTNNLYSYASKRNVQSGTTYTLASTDAGKIVELNNAGAITLTLPNSLVVDFCCTVVQTGAGQVTLSPAAGAILQNRSAFTKTKGQWAVLSLYVTTNSGATAVYVMAGDGA